MSIAVWPQPDQVFPDANDVLITAAGALVDESQYIYDSIDAGYLLTQDPLGVYMPDDRTTVAAPVAPFEIPVQGVSVWPTVGQTFPDANGDPITSIGALVDASQYIADSIDAGYLLTTDPLGVYAPDDRTTAVAPVAPFTIPVNGVSVWPTLGNTYPDANGVPILAAGALVDASQYIADSIDAGYLLTTDPLGVFNPDDRTTAVVPVAPFDLVGSGISVWPTVGNEYPDAMGVMITAIGAKVGESAYIAQAIDAGLLLTWDPLGIYEPDDRTGPESGAAAPAGAPYILAVATPALAASRLLVAGDNVTITDGGPGGEIEISVSPGAGLGDVNGPASSTNGQVPRFSGTTGKILQNSAVTIDDGGGLLGVNDITMSGDIVLTTLGATVDGVDLTAQAAVITALGAEVDALAVPSYVTLANTGTLTNERALAATAPVVLTDGGPGGAVTLSAPTAVVGPVSAVDNHVARFDGTTGKLIQNSDVVIDDSGNVAAAGLTLSGNITMSTPGATVDGVDLTALDAEVDTKVTGPALAVDESVARFDGITGKLVQGSPLVITDAGAATGLTALTVTGNITVSGTVDGRDVSNDGATLDALAVPSYLTLTNAANLTNERALAVTAPIVLTDGGAGASATLSAPSVVVGPASSLDNQIALFSGTTGKLIKDGVNNPTIDASGNITMVGAATVDGVDVSALAASVTALGTGSYLTLSADAALSAERVLTAGTGVQFADTGANGTLTVSSTGNGARNNQSGTTYTPVLTDAGKSIQLLNAATITFTVPNTSTVNFPLGTEMFVIQDGAGVVNMVGAGGVTLQLPPGRSATTQGANSVVRIFHIFPNFWILEGDLVSSAQLLTLATTTQFANERVLTAGTGVQLTDGGAGSTLTVSSTGNGARNTQSGTTYTLVLADAGVTVSLNNASPITLTIPNTSTVNFPLGTEVYLHNGLAGVVSLVAAGGVTLISPLGRTASMVGIGSAARIFHLAANFWVLEGDFQSDAQLLALATSTQYPNERVFTAGVGMSFTDGGAGSTLTANNLHVANSQSGTTYTLVLADAGKQIHMFNAAAITLTVPTNAVAAIPVGSKIYVLQQSVGQVTISGAGVSFLVPTGKLAKTHGQSAVAVLIKAATNTWLVTGDLEDQTTALVLSASTSLPNERVLTAGTNVSFVDGGAGSTLTINASAGASVVAMPSNSQASPYTLVLTDAGKNVYMTSVGVDQTLTIPANASVAFPTGTMIQATQSGAGPLFIALAAGVTALVNNNQSYTGPITLPSLKAQHSVAHLHQAAINAWYIEGDFTPVVNVQTGTSYSLVQSDEGNVVGINNASNVTLGIPAYTTARIPIGATIRVVQYGAGQAVLTVAGGVTLNTPSGYSARTRQQGAEVVLTKTATDTWYVTGDLEDSTSYLTLGTTAAYPNERVLTAGQGISLTDAGAGGALTVAATFDRFVNNQVGTTYTTVLTDQNAVVTLGNGTGTTVTIPHSSTVNYPIGTELTFIQTGAFVTFVGAALVTVSAQAGKALKSSGAGAVVRAVKQSTNNWYFTGDMLGAGRVYAQVTGAQSLATGGGGTVIQWTEVYDEHGAFASNTFTAPCAGYYYVSVDIVIATTTDAAGLIRIRAGGGTYSTHVTTKVSGSNNVYATGQALIPMTAGSTVDVVAIQNSGASALIGTGNLSIFNISS